MKNKTLLLFLSILCPIFISASIQVGIHSIDITPPVGTPSAGYLERKGAGMEGILDPLLASALVIDNGEKKIALCSVDNLGFTFEMVRMITKIVQNQDSAIEVYIASSHTHSGGGGFLNIPYVGESLAGPYNESVRTSYVEKTAEAILTAAHSMIPAKLGIGFGSAADLSFYRSSWPENVTPLSAVTVMKITKMDGTPFAVLFNYPLHPTVLKSQNRLFSADFVGAARKQIEASLGLGVQAVYFNGAQGDIVPVSSLGCDEIGQSLAATVKEIWDSTVAIDTLIIETNKVSYSFKPETTPFGLLLPIKQYDSEMNLLVFNHQDAFLTIPGELSCLYDARLKDFGQSLGYRSVSIFGLTNDAHGYIITPESWLNKTFESKLSFGGQLYGDQIEERAKNLLRKNRLD